MINKLVHFAAFSISSRNGNIQHSEWNLLVVTKLNCFNYILVNVMNIVQQGNSRFAKISFMKQMHINSCMLFNFVFFNNCRWKTAKGLGLSELFVLYVYFAYLGRYSVLSTF